MRFGKQRYESEYMTIKYFYENNSWSINWMCKQLSVSRAAYYKWLHREVPIQEQENIELANLIKEYDERFNHILGYRRMTSWINHFNHTNYKKKRIHRIMKKLNIHSVIRKKKKKLYLSAIIDLYDRYPVSYVISCRNDNRLVFKTFDKAIISNPDAKPIFHSDRGFQYTSKVFQRKLMDQEMQQSMSRLGHCIDNGPTEGFWGIIKSEMYAMYEIKDEESLRFAIKDYLRFYAEERIQERYECKTSLEIRTEVLTAEVPMEYPIP